MGRDKPQNARTANPSVARLPYNSRIDSKASPTPPRVALAVLLSLFTSHQIRHFQTLPVRRDVQAAALRDSVRPLASESAGKSNNNSTMASNGDQTRASGSEFTTKPLFMVCSRAQNHYSSSGPPESRAAAAVFEKCLVSTRRAATESSREHTGHAAPPAVAAAPGLSLTHRKSR